MITPASREGTVVSVVGARPNFMKYAPVARALAERTSADHTVVHTGQHHDTGMSDVFFRDLRVPPPHHSLDVGSGSHAQQTATVMYRLEPLLAAIRPTWLLAYGDVNSTVAAALTAVKLGIPVAHVEAGLRSRDRTMPEEINRILTDHCSDLLLAPSTDAVENLLAEGIPRDRIHFVGNVMIDSVEWALPAAKSIGASAEYGLRGRDYVLVTMHRPSNVDDPVRLFRFMEVMRQVACTTPVLFPVHPRTAIQLHASHLDGRLNAGMQLVDPVSYLTMLSLMLNARLVVTDSGGVQEETSYLGVPCITVRTGTERPITCAEGTNRVVPPDSGGLLDAIETVLASPRPGRPTIERWDGCAANRIVDVLRGRKAYNN